MKDAYAIINKRWCQNKPLKLEEFTLEELEYAIAQGCEDRNYISYMHEIAKKVEKLRNNK